LKVILELWIGSFDIFGVGSDFIAQFSFATELISSNIVALLGRLVKFWWNLLFLN
jgi:hypothetical protein